MFCDHACLQADIFSFFFMSKATGMEMALVRRYIRSCEIPEVSMSVTSPKLPTSQIPDNGGVSSTSMEAKCSLKSPSTVAVLPRPCNSMSPVAGEVPPERGGVGKWLLVDKLNLTMKLVDDHDFSSTRSHPNSYEFCQHEWSAVESEVFKLLRERSGHDCFWLLQERTAIPVNNPKKKKLVASRSGIKIGVHVRRIFVRKLGTSSRRQGLSINATTAYRLVVLAN